MKERRAYYVYIVANATRILYTGMTSNLEGRIWDHKEKMIPGFTSNFNVCRLVYWESFDDVRKAIDREKQIKGWRREKKIKLIESLNPNWHDLSEDWYEKPKGVRSGKVVKSNGKGVVLRLALTLFALAQDDRVRMLTIVWVWFVY